jgi:hypothetical protein
MARRGNAKVAHPSIDIFVHVRDPKSAIAHAIEIPASDTPADA